MKRLPVRIEGYWYSPNKEGYEALPVPEAREKAWTGWDLFLDGLVVLQNSDKVEKAAFRGLSVCRLCGQGVGSEEYSCDAGGAYEWRWPEGLEHYVREHKVKPSKDFRTFVAKLRNKLRYEDDPEPIKYISKPWLRAGGG